MNFMFFIYIPLVHSVSHTFKTTYTETNGQTIAGIPQIYSVSTLDGWQIDYYDSNNRTVVPRQDWMKKFASGDKWKKYIEIRERVQETNKPFSQSDGVHMYERVYGCVWDDETEHSHGFDEYSYDGQEFISLDLKESRYTARVQQAEPTVLKWNRDTGQLDFLKQYYQHNCTDWLKELLKLSKATGQSLPGPLQTNLPVDDTKSSGSASGSSYTMHAVIIFLLVILTLIALYILRNNGKQLCRKYNQIKSYNVPRSSSQTL